jgi:acetyl esterase/lipase
LITPDGPRISDCIADCKSALRYLRTHAAELAIDPQRIAVAGDSAGGHLAAALGTLEDNDDPQDNRAVSAQPNAMLLFNPVLDLTEDDWVRYVVGGKALRDRTSPRPSSLEATVQARALSPLFHVRTGLPPTLLMHGRADVIVPWSQAQRFADAMRGAGNRCDLVLLEKTGHAFVVAYYKSPESVVVEIARTADGFLHSLGWLKGEPTLSVSSPPAWQPKSP